MEQTTSTEYISEYSTMSKEEFKELILMGKSKTRYETLNMLHHIINSSFWYCYYSHPENGKCKMCSIQIIFCDFEKDIEGNMFNVNFLFNYYTKLCHEFLEQFNQTVQLY